MATETKTSLLEAAARELGSSALETVKSSDIDGKVPDATATLPSVPPCITQDSTPRNLGSDPAALVVGLQSFIPRWKPGSVIKWTAWSSGFDSQEDANYAASQMSLAANKWNEADVGITFEFVALAKDANFAVSHGGPKGTVLASAYFPNNNDLNFVYVYSWAFSEGWKENLWKVFTHELGHVLGLRHEFALDPSSEEGRQLPGVQIGPRNELSVMNYRNEAPELQESDVTSTRAFYKLKGGSFISGTVIVDFTPL